MEAFHNLADAQVRIGLWRKYYNEERPHSALGYLAPLEALRQSSRDEEKILIL